MNQLERISRMESYLDEAQTIMKSLSLSLAAYHEIRPKLRELADYYSSEEWRRDFEDDEAGRLPQNLKRGVLSEDAVYNLLSDNKELLADMLSIVEQS